MGLQAQGLFRSFSAYSSEQFHEVSNWFYAQPLRSAPGFRQQTFNTQRQGLDGDVRRA